MRKNFSLPAGDIDILELGPLSFKEFLWIFNEGDLYETTSLYGASDVRNYDKLKQYYDLYIHTGGYPDVIKEYVTGHNLYNCTDVLEYVIRTFVDESKRYFQSVIDVELFDLVFSANASMAIREKKGTSDLATEISKIIFPEDSSDGRKITIPIALAGRLDFNLGSTKQMNFF